MHERVKRTGNDNMGSHYDRFAWFSQYVVRNLGWLKMGVYQIFRIWQDIFGNRDKQIEIFRNPTADAYKFIEIV